MRMLLGLRSPGLVVFVALASAHFVIGLLQLEDLHNVVQALFGVHAVVLAEVEGVDVKALSALETVAEGVGVVVDVLPAAISVIAGVCCRGMGGIGGRGCCSSGVLRSMVLRRLCGRSGPILMGDLRGSVRMWLLGLRSLGLPFCSCWRRSAVAL